MKRESENFEGKQDIFTTTQDEGVFDIQTAYEGMGHAGIWREKGQIDAQSFPQETQQMDVIVKTNQSRPNVYNLPQDNTMNNAFDDYDPRLETPSRTQSVPPICASHVTERKVDFANTPQIIGDHTHSPGFRSAELSREASPQQLPARSSSVQLVAEQMPMHHKSRLKDTSLHSRFRQKLSAVTNQPSRFEVVEEHRQRFVPLNHKVSAPESDVQESSEDDQARAPLKNINLTSSSDNIGGLNRKRLRESDNGLDYNLEQLKNKTLGELQQESFSKSPGEETKSRVDSNGNEMPLPQLLENLTKIQEEDQRDIFRTQTSEEWSQTGQWFVNKFSEDLKKLMAVRLERRKTALRYEDKVRRRQREVEWAQAGIEKELQELGTGGGELMRNRKAPSRAGTPLRPAHA